MASRNQIRKQYARWHAQYEREAYKELQKTFKKWGNQIPYTLLTEQNYETLIRLVINDAPMERTYAKIYTGIGLVHGKRVGKAVNRELKFFEPNTFESTFLADIRKFLSSSLYLDRINSVENTYFEAITKILRDRLDKGQTMRQAAKELQETVGKKNFYRWQAERIARTETTAAANYSAIEAGNTSGFVMEKVWISALDSRTRTTPPDNYDHRHMNGKTVKPNEDFNVSGEMLSYPGDPKGSAGNVVNCRCTVALRPVRDANGDLIEI